MWYFVFSSSSFCGQNGLDHVLQNVRAQIFVADRLGVLRRNHHRVDADRLAVLVVFHRHLALAVRPQVGHLTVLANLGQTPRQLVRKRDRGRHQLFGLVGGVAEHHALVARAAGVHAHGDVARLLVDRRDHGAGVRVEAVERIVVADRGNHAAHQRLEVNVSVGRDLSRDDHQSGCGQGLAGHAAVGILLEAGIENGVGDLVGDLVGMSFGHGLRREQKFVACGQSGILRGG